MFSIVLEGVPKELGQIITKKLQIPTIGIGAGNGCNGQIQVFHDIMGLFNDKIPKHAKRYTNNYENMKKALSQYCTEVENREFPNQENTIKMNSLELERLKKNIENI